MRFIPFLFNFLLSLMVVAKAQVTPIVANKGLQPIATITKSKMVMTSALYNNVWITDATTGGTFQFPDTLTYDGAGGVLNEKLIFAAVTPTYGSELWITDGTAAGTKLLKDIYPDKDGSFPFDDFALLNGRLYFTAVAPGVGRELWRTDGTAEGTVMVSDIVPGPAGSALKDKYDIFSTGSYLLFSLPRAGAGYGLWRSDGTAEGTYQLKNINPGIFAQASPSYQLYHNRVLFLATDAANGSELWRTDGTPEGTQVVKDIRPGTGSSMNALSFFPVNDRLVFVASDGISGDEFWSTDGTEAGTVLLKDIEPGSERSYVNTTNAVSIGTKMFFAAYNHSTGTELWETDGTQAGTKMIHEVLPGLDGGIIQLLPNLSADGKAPQPMPAGKPFFFLLGLPLGGVEVWKSDGTTGGTAKVKTIKMTNNTITNLSQVYTTTGIYFSVDDGMNGQELWKSDGSAAGTLMVADINSGSGSSDIQFLLSTVNNKILFTANDGDSNWATDLYRLDVDVITLPVRLGEFSATLQATGVLLKWYTLQEQNSRDFVIERSEDGAHFTAIGTVAAAGSSNAKRLYSFMDASAVNLSRKLVYYRLQLRDADGKNTQSEVIALNLKATTAGDLSLLGNPVQDVVRLAVNGPANQLLLSVRDASGRTVNAISHKGGGNIVSIPVSGLTPGVYFLLAEAEGTVRTIRFIKQ